MGKGKSSRHQAWRQNKIQADKRAREAKKEQQSETLINTTELGPEQTGRIISHFGANFAVQDSTGKNHLCLTRRNLPKLVCGDYVTWQSVSEHEGIIVALQARSSLLARPDYQKQLKPIAANIDLILIVIAPQPPFDEDLVNRYLVAATLTKITPVIVLNKIDMLKAEQQQKIERRLEVYRQIGYQVIQTSTQQKHGLDDLLQTLSHKTSIFAGQSGVGKSSLIKTLLPNIEVRIGELSQATGLGKHTTTVTILYNIPNSSGAIIDSPGIREFGLGHITQAEIAEGFAEFQPLISHCKFNDCSHHSEPGCAIREAVEAGKVQRSRYDSFLRIVDASKRR